MPKANTRKITTAPATVKAAKTNVAKAATAARATLTTAQAVAGSKLASGVTDTAVKPVAPVAPVVPAVAKPTANITRTAATVAAERTNYGSLSDRDTAYLAFYKRLAATQSGGVLTIAAIVASGERPAYVGSNKPHDAGVIVRLTKANLITHATDGHSLTITPTGNTTKA